MSTTPADENCIDNNKWIKINYNDRIYEGNYTFTTRTRQKNKKKITNYQNSKHMKFYMDKEKKYVIKCKFNINTYIKYLIIPICSLQCVYSQIENCSIYIILITQLIHNKETHMVVHSAVRLLHKLLQFT